MPDPVDPQLQVAVDEARKNGHAEITFTDGSQIQVLYHGLSYWYRPNKDVAFVAIGEGGADYYLTADRAFLRPGVAQ